MNKYVREFLHRGLMFGGFGPIVFGIIILCISYFALKNATAIAPSSANSFHDHLSHFLYDTPTIPIARIMIPLVG